MFSGSQSHTRRVLVLIIVLAMPVLVGYYATRIAAMGTLTITSVASGHSSVKIYYQAVAGAKDYRVYDIANPKNVKYAGLARSKSNVDVPATVIDYNNVGDGQPHTVIVEAVDALGPAPHVNLYNADTNKALLAGGMLGSNKGLTDDGNTSTNGQGPYTNNPKVIAQSQPIVVQANRSRKAVPSTSAATQAFLDTFEGPEGNTFHQTARSDANETMSYTLNAGTPLAATIQYQLADTLDSMPFISSDHFMDMLFDGGTPGTNNPLHQGHGVMAYSPDATADFSNGKMLHITQEVDGHTSGRRWMDVVIVPANDPARAFDAATDAYNQSNDAVRLQLFANPTLDIFTGPSGGKSLPTGTAGGSYGASLWGALGQAPIYGPDMTFEQESLDNKSRYDFFLSQTHAALFVDGKLVIESDIPRGSFPWANQPVKIYYSHYLYHTDNDINELHKYACNSMNAYWYNDPLKGTLAGATACNTAYAAGFGFPRSDERHWDNMGFEVLPAPTGSFAGLASTVALPPKEAPRFATGGTTGTVTKTPGTPTATPTMAMPMSTATTAPRARCPAGSANSTAKKAVGDATCDGVVDISDFEAWRQEFTHGAATIYADYDGNGTTDLADFEIWRTNYLGR